MEPTQQFLHDTFTTGSNGEKMVGRQFFCPVCIIVLNFFQVASQAINLCLYLLQHLAAGLWCHVDREHLRKVLEMLIKRTSVC